METIGDKFKVSKGGVLSMAERYLERALDLFDKKKYEDALTDIDEAIRLERRNAELRATRGFILMEMGEMEAAELEFQAAIKADPSQWIVHYARAMQAFKANDFDAALQHLSEGQKASGFRPELFVYRAAAFYHKGNKARAEAEIDAAKQAVDEQLNVDPNNKVLKSIRTEVNKWRKTIQKMR